MRITLIAMSGVRAYNPELTELGMTLPGFVERGKTVASLPSLSLLTLAALTPDRHEVSYHEVADIDVAMEQCRPAGFHCLRPPLSSPAYEDRKVAWVYSKQYGLFELLERQPPGA